MLSRRLEDILICDESARTESNGLIQLSINEDKEEKSGEAHSSHIVRNGRQATVGYKPRYGRDRNNQYQSE